MQDNTTHHCLTSKLQVEGPKANHTKNNLPTKKFQSFSTQNTSNLSMNFKNTHQTVGKKLSRRKRPLIQANLTPRRQVSVKILKQKICLIKTLENLPPKRQPNNKDLDSTRS